MEPITGKPTKSGHYWVYTPGMGADVFEKGMDIYSVWSDGRGEMLCLAPYIDEELQRISETPSNWIWYGPLIPPTKPKP